MTTLDVITVLFCQVDDYLSDLPKHLHATVWPSEIVTLGLLHTRKGGGNRAFYRWLTQLPHSTPCFGFMKAHKCLVFKKELWKPI